MDIPAGHTESGVLEVIDNVVNSLASQFTFGYFDLDDIKQEGRVIAIKALIKFNPNKGATLKTFLYTEVWNKLYNLRRNKFFRPQPKDIDEKTLEVWLRRNTAKRSLMESSNIEECEYSSHKQTNFIDDIQNEELLKIIDNYLPIEYRSDYLKLISNSKLPKHRRSKIVRLIKEIISEHYQ